MKAAYFEQFGHKITIENLPDPAPNADEAIVQVKATGLCRSDWHGWMGHDSDIQLPHVPGHELAGVIVAVGKGVKHWQVGDRVTVPFCLGCGHCQQCHSGNQQICDRYEQPGFTYWGSFAELVKIKYADQNLVRLPEAMDFATAAVLGCRFITSYRGVVAQGKVEAEQWVAIHGCGGVGLSAIMIAVAMGAQVIAIDIDTEKLAFAKKIGATLTLNARQQKNIPEAIQELTSGGAHLSIDALGSKITCYNSILGLRKRGRHIQIGLLSGSEARPEIPMETVISKELEILGSHGMQAHQYTPMLDLIHSGKLQPHLMIGRQISLQEGINELMEMHAFKQVGVSVIGSF
ncbi:MAG: alcohol dehydrogenase [Saprospiraceae bacterium]|nr:MAG: alcohol dehydrogenase [Saprospiraceae bacterium]